MKIKQGDQLLLKFGQDKVHLSNTKFIEKSKVEIHPTRIINDGVNWEISVIKYIPEEKRLFVEIINYQARDNNFSALQNEMIDKNDVDRINFKKIDTFGLLNSSSLSPEEKTARANLSKKLNKPLTKEINISFDFPIKHISFLNGCIEFTKFVKETNREVKFEIQNPSIKEEYDSIKNYFESYLKVKKITVQAQITFTINDIIDCNAKSNEIAKINESAIESVRFNFVRDTFIKSKKDEEPSKNLYTIDELYNELTEKKVKSDTFHTSPEDLMSDMITIKSSKHYKQLRYLSSRHLSKILNLRFVLKPSSFVFLLENKEIYFIIWETLNTSEATYIWMVEPKKIDDLKAKLVDIDNIIGKIKEGGKRLYLNENPKNFKKINHDYADKEKGVKNWIKELENILSLQ